MYVINFVRKFCTAGIAESLELSKATPSKTTVQGKPRLQVT